MSNFHKVSLKLARWVIVGIFSYFAVSSTASAFPADPLKSGLQLTTFDIDATPPVGSLLTYDREINKWDLGLRAKGIVILGAGQPIVLCAVDWIGIANEGQDAFLEALADAAGTIPSRVAIHTLHQHDAPFCDFGAEKLLIEAGMDPMAFEGTFARELISRLKTAVKQSLNHTQPISHIGLGEAEVFKVASNRRILGKDGLVRATRYSSCKDPVLIAEPEGTIDPILSMVSFWNGDKPVAVLSYYATHPQSYYQTAVANPDFPGVARFMRQLAVPQALHIHFNGAGGNVTAGKYNDESPENRGILAGRLADGMKRAWESTRREAITPEAIAWNVEPLALPASKNQEEMQTWLTTKDSIFIVNNLSMLVFLRRSQAGKQLDIRCLRLGSARILFAPGEMFVEYQLAAKAIRPDLFVALAAYGDYAPEYICTAVAYKEGGYEPGASGVTDEAEAIIMAAIRKLLQEKQ